MQMMVMIMEYSNEDYMYDPIKNDKYFISETEYFDIVKKADYGYLLKDKKSNTYYSCEQTIQGYIYKDYEAFKDGKGICYIPESSFTGFNSLNDYISSKMVKEYSKADINNGVKKELYQNYSDCFKSKKIPKKLIEGISEFVIDVVDWQAPESFIYETDWTEDIMNYFENNKEDIGFASDLLLEQLEEKESIESEMNL